MRFLCRIQIKIRLLNVDGACMGEDIPVPTFCLLQESGVMQEPDRTRCSFAL